MKKLSLTSLFLSIILMANSQWKETNLTEFNFFTVPSATSHNGELLGLVFNSISSDLYMMNADETSWTKKVFSGVNEVANAIESTGSSLYLSANGLGYGMVYHSTDNAATFVADTAGLPKVFSGIAATYGLKYFDGKIVVNLGSAGYWLKDINEDLWQHIDPATSLNGGTDPICFSNDQLFAFDNSGASILYVSNDFGQTWETVNSNLPKTFTGKLFEANLTTGRLYLAGGKADGTEYGIYYSDNSGTTWVKADLSAFIKTDANGGQQEVSALYANGDEIYVALENDAANTTPDILSSESGITALAVDTEGLIVDPAGSIKGTKFLSHEGSIALILNVRDIYLKDSGTSNSLRHSNLIDISIYPNPSKSYIKVNSNIEYSAVQLYDLLGNQVLTSYSDELKISEIPKGMYILKIMGTKNQPIYSKKIIKH